MYSEKTGDSLAYFLVFTNSFGPTTTTTVFGTLDTGILLLCLFGAEKIVEHAAAGCGMHCTVPNEDLKPEMVNSPLLATFKGWGEYQKQEQGLKIMHGIREAIPDKKSQNCGLFPYPP